MDDQQSTTTNDSRNQKQWIYTDELINRMHCNNAGNTTIKYGKTDVAKKNENRELVAVLEVLSSAIVVELQALPTVLLAMAALLMEVLVPGSSDSTR